MKQIISLLAFLFFCSLFSSAQRQHDGPVILSKKNQWLFNNSRKFLIKNHVKIDTAVAFKIIQHSLQANKMDGCNPICNLNALPVEGLELSGERKSNLIVKLKFYLVYPLI